MGAVAEALPFVQAGIPEQGYGVGAKAGKKGSGETPDSQLFADLMARYAPNPQTDKTGESSEPPKPQAIVDDLRGASASLSPAVLELLASLREDARPAGEASSLLHDESEGAERDLENTQEAGLPLEAEAGARMLFPSEIPFDGLTPQFLLTPLQNPLGLGQASAGEASSGPLQSIPKGGAELQEGGPLLQAQSAVPPFEGGVEDAMEQLLRVSDSPSDGALSPEGRTAGEGELLPVEKEAEGQTPVAAETPLAEAVLLQGVGVPLSGTRAVLEEASRLGDLKTAPQTSVLDAGSERAGTMDALSSLLARSGERCGTQEPGASEEKDAEGQAVSVPDGGEGRGSARRSLGEAAGREDARDSGDDGASRRRARAVVSEASRQKDAEELPRSERAGTRTDFQSFFDGILENRRFAQSAAPLELTRSALPNPGEVLREGVENVVRFARVNGEQRASLIVDPPALGRLTVELVSGTSGLEASIKVSSEQVRYLVQDQIVQLRMSLAQQGVQLAHFSVDVQQDDGRRQQGFERGQGRLRRRGGVSGEDDEAANPVFRVDLNEGLLHWVG